MATAIEAIPLGKTKRRWRAVTAAKIAGLTLLLLCVWAVVYLRANYHGFTTALVNYSRYATVAENRNLFFCLRYWFEFAGKLRLSEDGFYRFDGIVEDGLTDFERGRLAYHRGEFPLAIKSLERDLQQNGESETKLFWLALSYLRQAEAENCLSRLHGESSHGAHTPPELAQWCALPLTQFHDRAASARTSARLFQKLLDDYDGGNRLYQWLLNFNYMTVNGFPQEVPPKYLIRSPFVDAFYGAARAQTAAQFAWLAFAERAAELGVATHNTGRGAAVEDFDHDGWLDIVTGGGFETLKYYRNERGQQFSDRTAEAGLSDVKQPFFISSADFDNDGWMDLFVTRMFGKSCLLLRNNQDGTFSDVTSAAGLLDGKTDEQIVSAWTPAWADVNNDGYLDLFLAQMGMKIPLAQGVLARPRMDSVLFLNARGHFVDKTEEYGLNDLVADQYFIGAAFGDYDNDGFADLCLASPLINTSVLLRNVVGARFEKTGVLNRAPGGFGVAFFDVNHDGRLDLFRGGFADARTAVELAVFDEGRKSYYSGYSAILLQTPEGSFQELKDFFDHPMGSMGASFGDLNNDGCHDFYLGTGTPEGWFVLPNLLYAGQAQGTRCAPQATNITMLQSFGTIQKGHGIVFFDFNNDGLQDVYSSLGGMWPADAWPNQFFVNQSKVNNRWVKIRLRGQQTNYFGLGATIKVTAINQQGEEIVRTALMDQKTGFGSGPYLAHIGLLDAVRIREVRVYWPASRNWKTYPAELNKLNTFAEASMPYSGSTP